jgi:hypothetical protein
MVNYLYVFGENSLNIFKKMLYKNNSQGAAAIALDFFKSKKSKPPFHALFMCTLKILQAYQSGEIVRCRVNAKIF